jgi:hypothetical protein
LWNITVSAIVVCDNNKQLKKRRKGIASLCSFYITTGTKECRFPHWEASQEVITEIAAHTEFGEAEVTQGESLSENGVDYRQ